MAPINVLLVEDTETDALLIARYLRFDGRFTLQHVTDLACASRALSNGSRPDVVVLDLNLPDSSGVETFLSLHHAHQDMPIVILSGQDDEVVAVQTLGRGAQDYVSKNDLSGAVLVRSLLYAMERSARLLAERRNRHMEEELASAHRIQAHLLPAAAPVVEGFDIAGLCQPAESCAGDFFDFIALPDGKWDLVIADVTGHGFGPALIMAGTRRILRSCAALHNDLGDIMTIANLAVAEDTLIEQFVTAFFIRLDPKRSSLTYSAAGHPGCIIRRNGFAEDLPYDSLPLGLMSETRYELDGSVTLEVGDIVLLMTDGVWECCSSEGEYFGRKRVHEFVHENRDCCAEELLQRLLQRVREFGHPAELEDDVTIVVAKVVD